MRTYGRKAAALLSALVFSAILPVQVMAETASAGVATGDETPIIALILCIVGVAIIVIALKKRK